MDAPAPVPSVIVPPPPIKVEKVVSPEEKKFALPATPSSSRKRKQPATPKSKSATPSSRRKGWKPKLKPLYGSSRRYREDLLMIRVRRVVLTHLWKMLHEQWGCTSNYTLDTVQDLAIADLWPLPFAGEQPCDNVVDVRGELRWKVVDPKSQNLVRVFFVHDLDARLIKAVRTFVNNDMAKSYCVFVYDNGLTLEKVSGGTTIPMRCLFFCVDRLQYDNTKQYYCLLNRPEALDDKQIEEVMKQYETDPTKYPVIYHDDFMLHFFFGFHPPKMIRAQRLSPCTGLSPYYRVLQSHSR